MQVRMLVSLLALVAVSAGAQLPSYSPQANAAGAVTTPLSPVQAITPNASNNNAQRLATPAVVPDDDYRIGPQDLLEVQVYGIEGLKREVRVNSKGAISLPLIGVVAVGGLSQQEAETLIADKYGKDYLQDPQVSLFIKEFTSQRITVEGAVQKPGIYPVRGSTTLLQAIALAGGQGSLSDMNEVMLYRTENGEKKKYVYDVVKIRGGELEDPTLANEDVVVVKRSAARVVLKDSIVRDVLDAVNPFSYLHP